MLTDIHCHIDAYPHPAQVLADGVHTVAATTSLASFVRTRILCRHHPQVQVALGLHPRRIGTGYDQWLEWGQLLETAPLVSEVGLDFGEGNEEHWAAQVRHLSEIAAACARENRALVLHSRYAEAEVWDVVMARHVPWVVWHDYRPEGPKSLLYRAIEAGHLISVGPEVVQNASLRQRLRAIPRTQVLTETNGPYGLLGTADRVAALRDILSILAEAWHCSPQEAEIQVERNYAQLLDRRSF